jgi:arsenite methyltransferase
MSTKPIQGSPEDIRSAVRQRYGQHAAKSSSRTNCCSQTSCCGSQEDPAPLDTISKLYEVPDAATLPTEVTELSLGCGDPITLATLKPGETVLDLGSGGGIDCFLAARRVGDSGQVIGVDMTAEMIEKARANKEKLGASNVEFRLGEIEHLPVADHSVDVIISNCVINLSPDKPQVFREAYRALKSSGRLAVSDIVTEGPLPEPIRNSLSAWAGCVAGALDIKDYTAAIERAGFVDIQITPVYWDKGDIDTALAEFDQGRMIQLDKEKLYHSIFSAKIKARKP